MNDRIAVCIDAHELAAYTLYTHPRLVHRARSDIVDVSSISNPEFADYFTVFLEDIELLKLDIARRNVYFGNADLVIFLCFDLVESANLKRKILSTYKRPEKVKPESRYKTDIFSFTKRLISILHQVSPRFGLSSSVLEACDIIPTVITTGEYKHAVIVGRSTQYASLISDFVTLYALDAIPSSIMEFERYWYTPESFIAKFGFPADWFNLYKAMVGEKRPWTHTHAIPKLPFHKPE